MKELLSCVYMAKYGDSYRAFMTHNPAIDAALLFKDNSDGLIYILSPYLPVGISEFILKAVFTSEEIAGCKLPSCHTSTMTRVLQFFRHSVVDEDFVHSKYRQVSGLLKKFAGLLGHSFVWPDDKVYPIKAHSQETSWAVPSELSAEVVKALGGRILFLEELEQSLQENRTDWCDGAGKRYPAGVGLDLLDVLQDLILKGHVNIFPSLGFRAPGIIRCRRCGWETVLRDGNGIPFCCEQCRQLGEARLGRALFAMEERRQPYDRIKQRAVDPVGVPPLTSAQRRASTQLKDMMINKSLKECLLWAVAGAGKTEVVLEVIAETVRRGGRVLYATPRRDVVMEIAPRLEKSFPGLAIKAVYGGSQEKYTFADLVIATTHQVIRYFRAFDLVIMDEVDAYPYRNNKMLENGVVRAVREYGKIIYLTATPTPDLLAKVRNGKANLITIPARHHGHPVPEPGFLRREPFMKTSSGLTKPEPLVMELLKNWLGAGNQIFVFLPTVRMVETYGSILRAALSDESIYEGIISCSHSKDPLRDSKRDDFKKGLTRVFVTTSIMERGITVKKANVMVLEAGYEQIFDEGSLIQMAGRAGRSTQYPDGEVVFVSRHVTGAMKGAKSKIRYMNEQARKNGFLKPEFLT